MVVRSRQLPIVRVSRAQFEMRHLWANMSCAQLQECRQLSIAMACTEAIHKLQIFQHTLRLKHSTTAVSRRASSASIPPKNSNHKTLLSDELLNDIKLEKEVNELIEIYRVACEGSRPASEPGHKLFLQSIEARQENDNREAQLRQQLKESQSKLKSLQHEMKAQRVEAEQRLESSEDRIAELRHQRKHVRHINNLEFDLVVKWEESRGSQAIIFCEKLEEALDSQIRQLKRKIEGEQRLICGVEAFRSKQIEELKQQIAHWQQKYACESAKLEALIQDKQQRIQRLKKRQEHYQYICTERIQQVQDYLQQKAEEQQLLDLQMRRVESAVSIQAWWRGVMVRRCLGPFKKKKKTRKSKNSKSKANK